MTGVFMFMIERALKQKKMAEIENGKKTSSP